MALSLPDQWVWDFWLGEDASRFRLFYLWAPRYIEDPEQRHRNVSVGHAVSPDLVEWTVRPDALAPPWPRVGRLRHLDGVDHPPRRSLAPLLDGLLAPNGVWSNGSDWR